MIKTKAIITVLAVAVVTACAKPGDPPTGDDLAATLDAAGEGGEVLPVIERHVAGFGDAPTQVQLGELARLYYARSQYVASFSEDQSEALLTIACLLRRQALGGDPLAVSMPEMEKAEAELDKKLNRFDTAGLPLIKPGEGWSFHNGERFPDTEWAAPDFDDTFWSVGDAPFGYGVEGIATATKLESLLYLRRYFTVEDPAKVKTLRSRLHGDASVQVYLNGNAQLPIHLDPADLVEGSNTLAVIAQAPTLSPEEPLKAAHMSFDLELTANLPSAEHHLATVTDSALGTAIGKYWAALPEGLRKELLKTGDGS